MKFAFSLIAASVMLSFGIARAEVLSAERATELLARSMSANEKCAILSSDDASELTDLVQRAQHSLASKKGPAVANNAIEKGRMVGKAVNCDDTTAAAVRAVLAAARKAAASNPPQLRGTDQAEQATASAPIAEATADAEEVAPGEEPAAQTASLPAAQTVESASVVGPSVAEQSSMQPATPVAAVTEAAPELPKPVKSKPVTAKPKPATNKRKKEIKSAKPKDRRKKTVQAAQANSSLGAYADLAQYYYLQRRCRTISRTSLSRLYGQVVATHRATLRQHGAAATARAMRQAERTASIRGC